MKVVKDSWVKGVERGKANVNKGRPEWWQVIPLPERNLICSVMELLRTAKESKSPGVAVAAGKWEGSIGCFFKVRLINSRRKQKRELKEAGKPQNN